MNKMPTLAAYLAMCEFEATHVMVAHGNEAAHEEYHPMKPEILAYFKEIVWPKCYYDYQSNVARNSKASQYLEDRFRQLRNGICATKS
jgi:hypothetical protein